MNKKIPFPDRRTINVLLTILLFVVVLSVAFVARVVLVTFCFSILFAYLIDPIVRFVQRHSIFFKNLRGPHVAESYFALLLSLVLILYALAPGLPGRFAGLVREIPSLSDRLASGEVATDLGKKYGWSDTQTL